MAAPDLKRIPSSRACCESGFSARGRCRWKDRKEKRASGGGAGGLATADLLVSMPERGEAVPSASTKGEMRIAER